MNAPHHCGNCTHEFGQYEDAQGARHYVDYCCKCGRLWTLANDGEGMKKVKLAQVTKRPWGVPDVVLERARVK